LAVDITRDAEGKLMGLAIGVCDSDVIERCLITMPGELKHAPMAGCGINMTIGGSDTKFIPQRIIEQLKVAKINVYSVKLINNEIQIDYDY
ncbi:MAG TPA: hypothetical protein PLA77_06600, partial [Bacteroidales bacterium]|nr:hypothetical protein [Bacteroidales bacterium]